MRGIGRDPLIAVQGMSSTPRSVKDLAELRVPRPFATSSFGENRRSPPKPPGLGKNHSTNGSGWSGPSDIAAVFGVDVGRGGTVVSAAHDRCWGPLRSVDRALPASGLNSTDR